jgi:hypothetical protein
MSNKINGGMWKGVVALAAIAIVAIAIVVVFLVPPPQLGGVGCLFYSAASKPSGYTVYATISNNSTSPVAIEKVYFDGAEQAYSTDFPADIASIWSMNVGGQPAKALGVAYVGTLLVRVAGTNPDLTHTVRVVTNTSSFEFNVVKKFSSLSFDHYSIYIAPGIDYLTAYIGNTGSVSGYVVEVTMDGAVFDHVSDSPPKSGHSWSMLVDGGQTQVIGVNQQGVLYIDTSAICHSCTHLVKVSCSDGSSISFSFRPW